MLNRNLDALQPPHSGVETAIEGLQRVRGVCRGRKADADCDSAARGGVYRLADRRLARPLAAPDVDRDFRYRVWRHLRAGGCGADGVGGGEKFPSGKQYPKRDRKGKSRPETMKEEARPIVDITDEDQEALLKRAMRNTLILGMLSSMAVLIGSGWRSAAMLLTGTLISAASILEWQRLVRVINAKLNNRKAPRSAPAVVLFFVLRLTVFAGAIYGSLKCFQGSVVALLCGLGLAALTVGWEVVLLLRD